MHEAVQLARLWEKGVPPVAGGALDQTAVMLEAADFVWQEHARWKAYHQQKELDQIHG